MGQSMVRGGGLGALATLYPMEGFTLPHSMGGGARPHHPRHVRRRENKTAAFEFTFLTLLNTSKSLAIYSYMFILGLQPWTMVIRCGLTETDRPAADCDGTGPRPEFS